MVAFEISVNGRVIQTIGIGDRGMLQASVEWACIDQRKGTTFEELVVKGSGLIGNAGGALQWSDYYIEMGDEVTIRVVTRDEVEPGEPVPLPPFPRGE